MLNTYPKWKYLVLLGTLIIGVLYALPNLFGDDPALQIMGVHEGLLTDKTLSHIETALGQDLAPMRVEQTSEQLLLRFSNTETQMKARDVLHSALGSSYVVALNLAPATPAWLTAIGAKPMKLGLDLRGGVHFLIDVDVDTAIARQQARVMEDIRTQLREAKQHYIRVVQAENHTIVIDFSDSAGRDNAMIALRTALPEVDVSRNDSAAIQLQVTLNPATLQEIRLHTVEHTMATLHNRVNELGVAEAVVQRQGLNRIVVELPGIQETARAKDILGKTATLSFHLKDEGHDVQSALKGVVPPGTVLRHDRFGRPVLLKKSVILTGESITGAVTSADSRDGRPVVNVRLGGGSVALFKKMTRDNIGKQMAVLYVETQRIPGEQGAPDTIRTTEEIISLATIQSALGSQFQISGLSAHEAQDLSLLLRAGALPAAVSIIEERTVGPSLGKENIQTGVRSVYVGMALVLVFMTMYYSVFGLLANIALVVNLVLLVALLSILGATLTLPGIAGIVLTMGMAVDANVLIFERIREELRHGIAPQSCIHHGFERAMATIFDANITTLLVGIILFSIGLGPVRGFAVTLSIGILTSMLTAVLGTRALVNLFYGGKTKRVLRVGI